MDCLLIFLLIMSVVASTLSFSIRSHAKRMKIGRVQVTKSLKQVGHLESFNVGTYLAKRLIEVGVTEIFCVPGDYNLILLDQLLKFPGELKVICCCNELNAGYAADGYARAKGISAMAVTFTVGGLSAVNAVAGAYSDDLPMIVISGGPNSNDFASTRILHHTIGLLDRRQPRDIFNHVVCENVEIRSPKLAAEQIDQAIVAALINKKPVYIEIACNIAEEKVSVPIAFQLPAHRPSNSKSLALAVKDVKNLWSLASKPVIILGVKARGSKAYDAILNLANTAGCAVAVMPDAKGLFPEDHPQFIGTYWGFVSSVACCETVESSDLYIVIGARFNDYNTVGYTTLLRTKQLVTVGQHRLNTPEHEYGCVNLADFCESFAHAIVALNHKDATLKTYSKYHPINEPELPRNAQDGPLTMAVVKDGIQKILTSNTTLVVETGDAWFQGQKMRLPRGCGYEFQMQYGSIGWSVGAVLGLCAAQSGKRVVALIGDGSFQMSAQEISTIIRYGYDPVVFLINNKGYTIEAEIHDGAYNVIKNWEYAKVVKAFSAGDGIAATFKVKTERELYEAITHVKGMHTRGILFIECIIDKDDCSKELLEWGSRVAAANSRPYLEL